MNIYDKMGITADDTKEFSSAFLEVRTAGKIVEYPFKYKVVKARSFQVESSALPMNFIKPTEYIFTRRLDLPFASGAKVRLNGGRKMTVTNADYVYDNDKALINGDGRTGWNIALEGGG